MILYEVIRVIDSPEFTRPVEIGRKIPANTLKQWFGDDYQHKGRFTEFFTVCKTHHIVHCRIEPINREGQAHEGSQ